MDGFLLGLANGVTCVASCAPVMIPLLLGEGRRVKQNGWLLAQFLLGRLAGYLLFGALAWVTGYLLLQRTGTSAIVFGVVYVFMAVLLLLYGLGEFVRARRLPLVARAGKMATVGLAKLDQPGLAKLDQPGLAKLDQPGLAKLDQLGLAKFDQPGPGGASRPLGCPVPTRQLRQWLCFAPALFPFALGFLTGLNLCLPFIAAFAGASRQASLLGSVLFFAAFFAGTAVFFLPLPFVGAFRRAQGLRTIGKFAAIFVALYYLYTGILTLMGGLIS
ncbi:MAG: sulfite exporter TauE/SafE family protein [Chloroflexota bacterium]